MAPSISQWFTPVHETHEKLAVAASVQYNMLTELIEHYKRKYAAAKTIIIRLQEDVKSLQERLELQQRPQAAPRFVAEQGPIHDSGYSSGQSNGSKRRRIDIGPNYGIPQGGGSSPRSIHTPVVSLRFGAVSATGDPTPRAGGSATNGGSGYSGPVDQVQASGQLRTLNSQHYAYVAPSTPINGSALGRGMQQTTSYRGPSTMPPPAVHNRRLGSASVTHADADTRQGTAGTGGPINPVSRPIGQTFVGRFRPAGSAAPTPTLQKRGPGGASGDRTSSIASVGDGRRFVVGTSTGSKSSANGGQVFAAHARR